MILYAEGAYGRTANRADWLAGWDFRISGGIYGPYFSIRDIAKLKKRGYTIVEFWNRKKPLFTVDLAEATVPSTI
jgi:hypothetical protein